MGLSRSPGSWCAVCGVRFRADHRSGAGQKVCSAACRKVRRREQARVRRARDLDGHRQADQVRQQVLRALRRGAPGPRAVPSGRVTAPPVGELSRAGLASQPLGTKHEIMLAWDRASRLSRAGLERDLSKILGERSPSLASGRRDRPAVTRRLDGPGGGDRSGKREVAGQAAAACHAPATTGGRPA